MPVGVEPTFSTCCAETGRGREGECPPRPAADAFFVSGRMIDLPEVELCEPAVSA